MSRDADAYSLQCHACRCDIEIPASRVVDGRARCPGCDAVLLLDWRAEQGGAETP